MLQAPKKQVECETSASARWSHSGGVNSSYPRDALAMPLPLLHQQRTIEDGPFVISKDWIELFIGNEKMFSPDLEILWRPLFFALCANSSFLGESGSLGSLTL